MSIISLILIVVAAISNSLMTVSREHYNKSRLQWFNKPQFWDGSKQAELLFNSIMIGCLMGAVVLSNVYVINPVISFDLVFTLLVRYLMLGVLWFLTIDITSNHILIPHSKTHKEQS